jgi:hypothetical protein
MAQQHPLIVERGRAARIRAALAVVVIFAIFDRWAADPMFLLTYNVSNAMPWPLSTLVVVAPQMVVAALAGWMMAAWLKEGPAAACAMAALLFTYYLLAHWQHTVLVFSAVTPVDLAAESLVVPVAALVAYAITRRAMTVRSASVPGQSETRDGPLLRLVIGLVAVVVAELFVLRPVGGLLLLTLGAAPLWLAPLWLSVGQLAVYLAAGYVIRRQGLLPRTEATLLVVFACAAHAGLWVWPAQYVQSGLAVALVWVPLLAIPLAFGAGWYWAQHQRLPGQEG